MKNTKTITAIAAALAFAGMSSAYAAAPVDITASDAQSGHPAENTFDGSYDTRWSAQGEGQWIQYDFGAPVSLEAIEIAFLKGDSRTSTFQILSSDDASSWAQQPKTTADGSSAELQSYAFSSDVTAQYFRVVGYGNSSNNWNSITEIEFVDGGVTPPPPPPPCDGPVASTDDGNVPANVVDGDLSTRWSANGDGQTIRLDLCEESNVSGVDLAFFKGDSRSSTFSIAVSSDDSSWTTVLSEVNSGSSTLEEQTFSFDALSARYVRYTGFGNSSNSWNSVTEFSAITCDPEVEDCDVLDCSVTPDDSRCPPIDVCDIDYDSQDCLDQRCPLDPYGDGCPPITGDNCADFGQMEYNGECADYSEVYEAEHGDIGEEDHLTSLSPLEMSFDALAAKHVTSNGNGWRHELKIKSSGGYRVGMTELFEEFKATITAHLDDGAKTIVAQHHADNTDTITKLYIADLGEGNFEPAPDGTESNSKAMDGIFDVYIRLANPDGDGETKYLLTTIRSGESFDFEEINDHGVVTVKINGQALESISVADSSESYFKFGNYQQAQNPETGEKLGKDRQDEWPDLFDKYFSTSVITFTNMSYVRTLD